MKVHLIRPTSFETARSRLILVTAQCHESLTPLYFLISILYTFDKKSLPKRHFQTFDSLGENSPNSSCHLWYCKSVFLYTLHHSSASWDITLLYFFSWNCTWFGQKEQSSKFKTFDCSSKISPNLYFDRLLTVYKILAKSMEELCLMTLKIGAKFAEKLIYFKNDKNFMKFDVSTQKP